MCAHWQAKAAEVSYVAGRRAERAKSWPAVACGPREAPCGPLGGARQLGAELQSKLAQKVGNLTPSKVQLTRFGFARPEHLGAPLVQRCSARGHQRLGLVAGSRDWVQRLGLETGSYLGVGGLVASVALVWAPASVIRRPVLLARGQCSSAACGPPGRKGVSGRRARLPLGRSAGLRALELRLAPRRRPIRGQIAAIEKIQQARNGPSGGEWQARGSRLASGAGPCGLCVIFSTYWPVVLALWACSVAQSASRGTAAAR